MKQQIHLNTLRAFPQKARPNLQRGVSLIEVMVGVALGVVASFVIVQAFTSSETFRRNISGSADTHQSMALAAYTLDSFMQEAGSSMMDRTWGCELKIQHDDGTGMKATYDGAPKAPFNNLPATLRVVPAALANGSVDAGGTEGSDTVFIMAADSAGSIQAAPEMIQTGGSKITLGNETAVNPGDFILATKGAVDASMTPGMCQVVQVASSYTGPTTVTDSTLGGKVIVPSPDPIPLDTSTYDSLDSKFTGTSGSLGFHLGASPTFMVMAVNAQQQLVGWDLLRGVQQVLAENVYFLKARYGIANETTGVIDQWVAPKGDYVIDKVMSGTLSENNYKSLVGKIKAIRVTIVARSPQRVQDDSKPKNLVLFADLPTSAQYTLDLTSVGKDAYRYQTFDWIIPLRNVAAAGLAKRDLSVPE